MTFALWIDEKRFVAARKEMTADFVARIVSHRAHRVEPSHAPDQVGADVFHQE